VGVSQSAPGRQIEISIKKLRARGEFRQLLKKRKPIFESIEIEGADVRINQEVAGKIDLRAALSGLDNALGYVKKIKLKDISLAIILPSQKISLLKADLDLSKSHQAGTYEFGLECQSIEANQNNRNIRCESKLTSSGTFSLRDRVSVDGNLQLSEFHFATPWIEDKFNVISITLMGEFNPDERVISGPQWTADITGLAVASGTKRGMGRRRKSTNTRGISAAVRAWGIFFILTLIIIMSIFE